MSETRITPETVVAELAATIAEWNEADANGDPAALDAATGRIQLLEPLMSGIHHETPEHALFCALLAIEALAKVVGRALGDADRPTVANIENDLRKALNTLAKAVQPEPGSPWALILAHYVVGLDTGKEPEAP